MPVVEVTPHFLTEEDVQRAGRALLGDVDFYEAEPLMTPVYSKTELQEIINRWCKFRPNGVVFSLWAVYVFRFKRCGSFG